MSYALFDTANKSITFNYQTILSEGFSINSNLVIGTIIGSQNDSVSIYNTQDARKASILLYEDNQKTKDIGIFMVASNVRNFEIGLYGASNNSNAFIQTRSTTDIAIATNSIERMRFKSNGNIGIGTTNPVYPLQISVNSIFMGNLGIGTINPRSQLDVQGTTLFSGNIGIGTAFPKSQLDVQGTTLFSGNIGIGTTFPRSIIDIQGDSLFFGNIGVGTNVPNYPLHVSGNIYTNGSLLTNVLNKALLAYTTAVTVGGGISPTGTWINRPINTIIYNDITNVGITTASSYFTLSKGTYKCSARASAYNCGYNRIRLIRGITEVAYGMSHYAASNIEIEAYLDTIFTQSTTSENYYIQHWTEFSSTDGLGKPRGTGLISNDNIFLMIDISKLN